MEWVKYAHIMCVIISLMGLYLRVTWSIFNPALLGRKWVKISPHVVDTLLLLSGILLAVNYSFGDKTWLYVKLLCLLLYIASGMVALKLAKTTITKLAAVVLASLIYSNMIVIALTHSPLGWLAYL